MNPNLIISFTAVGAALLGFWFVARFPERGPQGLTSGLLGMALAVGALSCTGPLTTAAAGSFGRYGPALALLLVALPALTSVFWAAGCLIRAIANLSTVR